MVYSRHTWNPGAAPAINAQALNDIEQGIVDAHALASSAASGGSSTIGVGEVLIDSLTSSTSDDDMLLAARAHHRSRMGDSSTASLAPTYRLGLRRYTFTQTFNPLNGMNLKGSGWLQQSVVSSSSHPSAHTQVKLAIVSGAASVPWIDGSQSTDAAGNVIAPVGKSLWDFNIGNMNIYSDLANNTAFRAPLIDSNHSGFRECSFHNLVCQNLYSVFGTAAEGCAMTICDVSGPGWQITDCRAQGVTIQGSDNGWIFADGCDWFNITNSTTGGEKWMGEFRSFGKSNIGPVYVTARNGWRGLKFTGGSTTFGGTLYGAKIEGNNEQVGEQCNGSLMRIEGGTYSFVGCTVDDGMANPSLTATPNGGTADRGLIEILGSAVVSMSDFHVAHGNTPPITTPVVYASGTSEVYLRTFLRGQRGQAWGTQRPVVVDATSGQFVADASVVLG